jgi:hypothetical protein
MYSALTDRLFTGRDMFAVKPKEERVCGQG